MKDNFPSNKESDEMRNELVQSTLKLQIRQSL